MRKVLLIAWMALALFSCKKDKPATGSDKKYPLKFNVSVFAQSSGPYGTKRTDDVDSIAAYADKLIFMLFDSSGKLVSQKTHQTDDESFESFSENAAPGEYTVVFIGRPARCRNKTLVSV